MSRRVLVPLVAIALALAGCASTPSATPGASAAVPSGAAPSSAAPAPSTAGTAGASGSPATPSVVVPSVTQGPSPTPVPTPVPPFRLTSPAFAEGDPIPRTYTCDGVDTSPALAWTGVPAGAKALVLVVDDPDAGGFAHWLVLDVRPDIPGLTRGAGTHVSAQAQGTNDFGRIGWGGPCPPSGEHRYRFTLYALAAPLGVAVGSHVDRVRAALADAKVLGNAVLLARYRRGG